ncbi:MAG: hypothetical protein F2681_13400 [Actinobacteria bacterium]|uniref:Unannotated protein n=1 Tax=freshwater metagenome TaxID=449393 RepID=A0A6J7NJ29_9ZZZZ|nr:hypothetical protein [Actinomycetota bacterium]MSW78638.1 hypothetical protein [Actinomycetota bacterium]MSX56943.1 hypothetical protein [Actinomycetota bacterium]MSX93133.1 hypothetical protein [Actinomycetota bacterium]MSZ84129.1 hypothetical protein [Actinomycetota bacterium]
MRPTRWIFVGLLFGLLVVGSSGPAAAQLGGECTASGVWQNKGLTVDAATIGNDLVTVPRKDTVDWTGSVGSAPGTYRGSVWLELPPPFGKVEIDSWHGTGTNTANSGSKTYSLPKFVPAGVEFTVSGEHIDSNGVCSGSVRVQVEGGPFDSPVTYAALVLTIATGGPLAALLLGMAKAAIAAGFGGAS